MRLNNTRLIVDTKIQDRYRKWFSELSNAEAIDSTYVILGDSDVDYNLAPNINKTRVLSAPYNVEGVKHKLIYNGVGKDLSGSIKCFVRIVNDDGSVSSLYDYSAGSETFTVGQIPPELADGKNWDTVTFTNVKMGMIFYFQTVLDYYLTTDNVKKALKETYSITVDWDGIDTAPFHWEYIIDNDNGSMLISKINTLLDPISVLYRGTITVVGELSKKTKKVHFNF